jgi:streptomycin 6-kinase
MTQSLPRIVIGPGVELPEMLMRRWMNHRGPVITMAWLDRLPDLLATWCDRYEITILPASPPISYNLVLFGTSRQIGDVVLKLSPPTPEVDSEIEALRQAAGHGMVRLIDSDPAAALMLLERIEPGTMLDNANFSDEESTRIGAEMMLQFWRTPARPDHLYPLEDWSRELLTYSPADRPDLPVIPPDLIALGVETGRHLIATQRDITLLHGDVHHQNILWGGDRGWVTIDPKGLVGERGYEIGTWMLNPWGFPERDDFLDLANRRLDIFAETLKEDRHRLAQWSVFHATLSLCWTLSDDQPEDITADIGFIRNMVKLLD